MKDLLAAGRAPLEVVSFGPSGSVGAAAVGMRQFRVALRNPSDKPVKAVQWTVFFLGEDGKLLADGKQDGGYAELGGIGPGETVEGVTGAPEKAVSGRLVLKSVVYESVPPGAENNETMKMYKLDLSWKNGKYDEEARAAGAGAAGPAK